MRLAEANTQAALDNHDLALISQSLDEQIAVLEALERDSSVIAGLSEK